MKQLHQRISLVGKLGYSRNTSTLADGCSVSQHTPTTPSPSCGVMSSPHSPDSSRGSAAIRGPRPNLFLQRVAERSISDQEFVKLFSPRMIEHLDDEGFEGAVHIFRSPSGAGKTTLLPGTSIFGRPDQHPYTPISFPHRKISSSHVLPAPNPRRSARVGTGTPDSRASFRHLCTLAPLLRRTSPVRGRPLHFLLPTNNAMQFRDSPRQ